MQTYHTLQVEYTTAMNEPRGGQVWQGVHGIADGLLSSPTGGRAPERAMYVRRSLTSSKECLLHT